MDALAEAVETYVEDQQGLWDQELVVTDRCSEEMLAAAYIRFKTEGLLEDIFYENKLGPPSLIWFMENFSKSGKIEVLAAIRKKPDGLHEHIGLGWLNSRTNVAGVFDKMEVGFAFFKQYHQPSLTRRATRLMIEYAFRYLGIESMFGTTPECNRAAILASKRIGFEQFGPLPHYTAWRGEPCGAVVSVMTKGRWAEIRG
jgi:RimJ/RimL family protein N-acetyltransferase